MTELWPVRAGMVLVVMSQGRNGTLLRHQSQMVPWQCVTCSLVLRIIPFYKVTLHTGYLNKRLQRKDNWYWLPVYQVERKQCTACSSIFITIWLSWFLIFFLKLKYKKNIYQHLLQPQTLNKETIQANVHVLLQLFHNFILMCSELHIAGVDILLELLRVLKNYNRLI